MNPEFFLIIVNPKYWDSKMDAVNFVKKVKVIFKEAHIKMIGNHQYDLPNNPKKKFDLKLWGIGRSNRNKVHKILTKFVN